MEKSHGEPEIAHRFYIWPRIIAYLLFALRTALDPRFIKDGIFIFWHMHFTSLPKCGADIVLPQHHLCLACALQEAALMCT